MSPRSLFALPPLWREGRIGLEAAALPLTTITAMIRATTTAPTPTYMGVFD